MKEKLKLVLLLLVTLQILTGCSSFLSGFSQDLNAAVKANNDPQTVIQALPTYLILLDGLLENDPEDEDILLASSKLINAYTALLGAELEMMPEELESDYAEFQRNKIKQQQKKLSLKSLERASTANCLYEDYLCNLTTIKYEMFENRLREVDEDDIEMLYVLGTAWASWLQTNSGDWNAMAQLPQIKLIMQKVISIDETWDNAGAHIYLGVLNSLLPVNFGGTPEQGKAHFQSAIKLTQGRNLMAKVLYAQYYSRLTFNKLLHQELISDVLSHKGTSSKFILINTIAIEKAKSLKESAKEYF